MLQQQGTPDLRWKAFRKYLKEKKGDRPDESYLIQALHVAQDFFGYVPKDAMDEISDKLNIPSAKVWAAATFYHYFTFKPCGRYRVSVCMGTACYVKGARKVLNRVREELGINTEDTTEDGMFSLDVKFCLGTCGISPVMMINDKVYGELTPDKASGIIKDIIRKDKKRRV